MIPDPKPTPRAPKTLTPSRPNYVPLAHTIRVRVPRALETLTLILANIIARTPAWKEAQILRTIKFKKNQYCNEQNPSQRKVRVIPLSLAITLSKKADVITSPFIFARLTLK